MSNKKLLVTSLLICQIVLICVATILIQVTFQDYSVVLSAGVVMLLAVLVMGCISFKISQSRTVKAVSILLLGLSAIQLPDAVLRRLAYTVMNPRTEAQKQSVKEQERRFNLRQQELEDQMKERAKNRTQVPTSNK